MHKKRVQLHTGLVWDTNMAAVSLFWDTNMAVVTSCENTLLVIVDAGAFCLEYLNIFLCFFIGGLFIFSIRCDSYDPVDYGYSATCEKLENSGKWKLILKEKRELHSTPNEERFRYCYLITYKVLQ